MIREIAQYISDELNWAIGPNKLLIVGHRSTAAPDSCVVLLERVGSMQDPMVPNRLDFRLQVLSCSPSYHTARDMAYQVYELLFGRNRSGFELVPVGDGPAYWVNVVVGNAPAWIGTGPRDLHQFSCNLTLRSSVRQDS